MLTEAIRLLEQANNYSIRLQMGEDWCVSVDAVLAAHSAGARASSGSLAFDYGNALVDKKLDPSYNAQPQPMPQTDAARDAEDAKRYRFIKSQMKVGAVQTQLPLYRTLHWIGYEDCSDVRNTDAAIDAEIERLDRAKGNDG